MKRIVVFAVATVCLLGCKQELHDPLLRQQLTTMVASLNDKDNFAAKKACDDIDAIVSVNSKKLSDEQRKKLSSIQNDLLALSSDLSTHKYDDALGRKSKGILDNNKDIAAEISDLLDKTKELISEVAATF